MNIKLRIRNLQDAMVISRAASATGQSVEELTRTALYREVTRIFDRINRTIAEDKNGSTAGVPKGDIAEVSQAGNADSDSLAEQEDTASQAAVATGTEG